MKKTGTLLLILTLLFPLSAFEWPQLLTEADDFSLFFGQARNDSFINSLVFKNPDTIQAADEGTVLITLDAGLADFGWFHSSLGNAVIIQHSNDMMTVYGNLEEVSISREATSVEQGAEIGLSGTSGWQKGKNCLEFQVIDRLRNTVINPFVLMPEITRKATMQLLNPVATNRQGLRCSITNGVKMSSGVWMLYIDRQKSGMTSRTTVSVNGAVVETITYDVLIQENNRLCFSGKRSYSYDEIYPDETRQLVADIILSKGINTITIQIVDIFGNEKTASFRVEVN